MEKLFKVKPEKKINYGGSIYRVTKEVIKNKTMCVGKDGARLWLKNDTEVTLAEPDKSKPKEKPQRARKPKEEANISDKE